MLVEDSPIIALSEKMELEKSGYNVHHVLSGENAVRTVLAGNIHFGLILMDVDLGRGIDGTAAAVQILEKADIPIVFLSSHTEPEYLAKIEKNHLLWVCRKGRRHKGTGYNHPRG